MEQQQQREQIEMEKFMQVYVNLLKYIKQEFPQLKLHLRDYYKKEFFQHFIENILPVIEDISLKNRDAFLYKHDIELVKGYKFRDILTICKKSKADTKKLDTVWRFIQTLYMSAYDSGKLSGNVGRQIQDSATRLEMNIQLSPDAHAVYMNNIIKSNNVVINPDSLESESDSEDESDDCEEEKSEKKEKTEEKEEKEEKKGKDGKEEENPLKGTMIGDLAEELSKEIPKEDMDKLEKYKDIKDPTEIMSRVFSDTDTFGNIINIAGKKFSEKIKSGEITREKMMQETMKIFGGPLGQSMMKEMMSGMMGGGNSGKKGSKKKHGKRRH
jgi:hypothetical protein